MSLKQLKNGLVVGDDLAPWFAKYGPRFERLWDRALSYDQLAIAVRVLDRSEIMAVLSAVAAMLAPHLAHDTPELAAIAARLVHADRSDLSRLAAALAQLPGPA